MLHDSALHKFMIDTSYHHPTNGQKRNDFIPTNYSQRISNISVT